jgi:hypothetical protein
VAERKRKKRKSYTDLFSFTFFSEQEVSWLVCFLLLWFFCF